jgi:hypothetical protein
LVGNTASTVGCLAGLKLGSGGVAHAFDIGDGGRGDGDEAKEKGGDGELHIGGLLELRSLSVRGINELIIGKVLISESDP